jgi:uncharacterized protein
VTSHSESQSIASAESAVTGERIEAIDALRGFALAGIVSVHMVEQYLAGPPPPSHPAFGTFSTIDSVVSGVVGFFFLGKFVAVFSLLFGLSFFIQMDGAARRGASFRGRFAWRLVILFAIGLAHHVLYRGDVLTIYALLGLVLLLFFDASDRTLAVSVLLLALGAPRLLLIGVDATFGTRTAIFDVDDAATQAYFDTLKGDSLLAVVATNLGEGFAAKLQFVFGLFARGYQTFALFLIGLYVGRKRWHESLPDLRRPLRRLALWGGAACLACLPIGAAVYFLTFAGVAPENLSTWRFLAPLALYDTFTLGLVAMLVSVFLLLFHRGGPGRYLRWFVPVGRMALTTYVTQSVVGTAIFYGYGLGLLGEIGAAAAFAIGIGVFAIQMALCAAWMRHFRYGPLEWLWRSMTYLKSQPLLKRQSIAPLERPAS